jgi:hypothetical protein
LSWPFPPAGVENRKQPATSNQRAIVSALKGR